MMKTNSLKSLVFDQPILIKDSSGSLQKVRYRGKSTAGQMKYRVMNKSSLNELVCDPSAFVEILEKGVENAAR